MNMRIDSAEITLWVEHDGAVDPLSLDLSPLQLKAITKVLGIKFNEDSKSYNIFSDKTLSRILSGEINIFKFKEV